MGLQLPDPYTHLATVTDPFKTHFFNACLVVSDGGAFFYRLGRYFRDQINRSGPEEQMRVFIGQEGQSQREHIDY